MIALPTPRRRSQTAIALGLASIWLVGFILLLTYTGTNPVEAGRSFVTKISISTPKVDPPVYRDEYDWMCARLPSVGNDLRELDKRWGKEALEMSVAHQGSGIRMRRTLRKLLNNETFTIAIIGGSISEGHGINKTRGQRYSDHLSDIFTQTYPKVKVFNGGLAGHGSDYFSSCYQNHVPTDADLYIVELAVNDIEHEAHLKEVGEVHNTAQFTEVLTRQLLSNRHDNAVMMLSTFGADKPFQNAAHLHNVVSEYYDIPRLSARTFMYPYMLQYPEERIARYDGPRDIRHPNEIGHEYMRDIIMRYLYREMCRATRDEHNNQVPRDPREYVPEVDKWLGKGSYNPDTVSDEDKPWLPYPGVGGYALKYNWDPFTLPALRLNQHWLRDEPRPEGASFCRTVDVIADDGLPKVRPSQNKGWEHYKTNDKNYWKATEPGSVITFDNIETHAGIIYLFALRCDQNYGNAKCWVDNDKGRAVTLVSTWNFICISALQVVSENVKPGNHTVSCEILQETNDKNGKHDFAIAGIISH